MNIKSKLDYIPLMRYDINTLRLWDNQRTWLPQILSNFVWKKSVGNEALFVWPSGDFRVNAHKFITFFVVNKHEYRWFKLISFWKSQLIIRRWSRNIVRWLSSEYLTTLLNCYHCCCRETIPLVKVVQISLSLKFDHFEVTVKNLSQPLHCYANFI